MSDTSHIDDLRRRVHEDPASIAFAQLAEECRRAGNLDEAISVSRAGLAAHPGFVSARVTLGRALLQVNQLDEARIEFERVLTTAPENLAAIRGLGQTHERQGRLADALAQYRVALALAPTDPELDQIVARLSRQDDVPVERPSAAPADERDRALRTVAALERWLDAIHVARADSRA